MSATPVKNLSIEAGTTFERVLRFYTDKARTVPMNLTGYTIAGQIRDGSFVIDITFEITDPAGGEVKMTIELADTRDVLPGKYAWDLLATSPSGKVSKYTKGTAEILKTETKLT